MRQDGAGCPKIKLELTVAADGVSSDGRVRVSESEKRQYLKRRAWPSGPGL